VQPGSVLGNIVRGDQDVSSSNVILYVPMDRGMLVEEGMEVNISPATVNKEEHGYIIGQIVSVSLYAVTQEHMMAVLQNQQLVHTFAGQNAVLEVEVELITNSETVSGYQWSSPRGAPFSISPGTICQGEIIVSSQRPIDMVIPFIKRLFI
jgi:HlyD family secretion protein